VATLGYKPLYDFSYTNAKEYRTQNGSLLVVNWTPYWSTAAKHIVEINSPGLENRYIRLPIDAEMDINRSDLARCRRRLLRKPLDRTLIDPTHSIPRINRDM
jgi:hypothetical protein